MHLQKEPRYCHCCWSGNYIENHCFREWQIVIPAEALRNSFTETVNHELSLEGLKSAAWEMRERGIRNKSNALINTAKLQGHFPTSILWWSLKI